jgi:hypothetical protein
MREDLLGSHHVEGVLSVDEDRLDTDLYYRFQFLAEYFNFTNRDIAFIHEHIEFIKSLVPRVIEKSLEKLLNFDVTRRLLLGTIHGVATELTTDPDELTMQSPSIKQRATVFEELFYEMFSSKFDEEYFNKTLARRLSYKWGNKMVDVPMALNSAANMNVQLLFAEYTLNSDLPLEIRSNLALVLSKVLNIYVDMTNTVNLNGIEVPEDITKIVITPIGSPNDGYIY